MAYPKLSRTIKSLLAKRGTASTRGVPPGGPPGSEAAASSTDTTVPDTTDAPNPSASTFSARSTLVLSSEPTVSPNPSPPRKISLTAFTPDQPQLVFNSLSSDLQQRVTQLAQGWGADPALVAVHVIQLALLRGAWSGDDTVADVIRVYLDASGLA